VAGRSRAKGQVGRPVVTEPDHLFCAARYDGQAMVLGTSIAVGNGSNKSNSHA
jgi:hypothetical protein